MQAPPLTAVTEPVVTGPAVMMLAETVHTAGVSDRNVTASPDDAFAVSGIRAPTCVPGGWGKETSCCCCPVPIWKVRATPAAANAESPGWVAVIVQAPALTAVASPIVVAGSAAGGPALPETVHTAGVSDRNEIAGPGSGAGDLTLGEVSRVTEAVRGTCAPTLVWGCPGWVPAGWGKETSCCCCPVPIWKARARSGAAANSVFPACEAVIVHTPAATVVTIVAETVHTSGVAERNETGSPDDALACRVTGVPTAVSAAPADVPPGCANLMLCRAAPIPAVGSAGAAVSRAGPAHAGWPDAGGSGPVSVAGPVRPATTQMPRSPQVPRQSLG